MVLMLYITNVGSVLKCCSVILNLFRIHKKLFRSIARWLISVLLVDPSLAAAINQGRDMLWRPSLPILHSAFQDQAITPVAIGADHLDRILSDTPKAETFRAIGQLETGQLPLTNGNLVKENIRSTTPLIVFMGPPAIGKTILAERLVQELNAGQQDMDRLCHINFTKILRHLDSMRVHPELRQSEDRGYQKSFYFTLWSAIPNQEKKHMVLSETTLVTLLNLVLHMAPYRHAKGFTLEGYPASRSQRITLENGGVPRLKKPVYVVLQTHAAPIRILEARFGRNVMKLTSFAFFKKSLDAYNNRVWTLDAELADEPQNVAIDVQVTGDSGGISENFRRLLMAFREKQMDPHQMAVALFEAGSAHYAAKDIDQAAAALKEAIQYDRQHIPSRNLLANIYVIKANYEAALKILDGTLAKDPKNLTALRLRLGLKRRQSAASALQDARRWAQLDPGNAYAYETLGEIYAVMRDQENALQSFERALVLKPESAAARRQRALVLGQINRLSEALQESARAIASDPNDPRGYAVRSTLLLQDGRRGDALRAIHDGTRLAGNHPDLSLAEVRELYGPDPRAEQKALELARRGRGQFSGHAGLKEWLQEYDRPRSQWSGTIRRGLIDFAGFVRDEGPTYSTTGMDFLRYVKAKYERLGQTRAISERTARRELQAGEALGLWYREKDRYIASPWLIELIQKTPKIIEEWATMAQLGALDIGELPKEGEKKVAAQRAVDELRKINITISVPVRSSGQSFQRAFGELQKEIKEYKGFIEELWNEHDEWGVIAQGTARQYFYAFVIPAYQRLLAAVEESARFGGVEPLYEKLIDIAGDMRFSTSKALSSQVEAFEEILRQLKTAMIQPVKKVPKPRIETAYAA